MPFCYAGASLNDADQHVDRFFAASPDIIFSWEPSSENIEARAPDRQSSLPPSQENRVLGNEPDIISPISLYKCAVCGKVTSDLSKHRRHLKRHGHTCYQCARSFTSHGDLNIHAEIHGHESYHCNDCGASFSRLDVLKRHKIQHAPSPVKYSCSHCKKWKAPNGFERKDHLTQHLRNYHHIDTENASVSYLCAIDSQSLSFYAYCLHQECPLFRSEDDRRDELETAPLFKSRGEFTKHMRKEHDETPFPCTKTGCKRVNGKGFFRKRDLIKHMKREHDISFENDVEAVEDTAVKVHPFLSEILSELQ